MSRRARASALLVIASWPAAAAAQSWTDTTRSRMIQDALKITPPALSEILLRYAKDLNRGMLEPSRHEGEEVHFQLADGRGGLAASGVTKKVGEIRGLLEPLYRGAYCRYVERVLDRIPFVVDRDEPAALQKNDIPGFVMDIARRAVRNYALIGPAFKDDGTPATPSALDERSVPFGIASLSYSHATSDIAWIWRHLWGSVNGDMRGTPFIGGPPPEKVQVPPRPPKGRHAPRAARTPGPSPAPQASPSPAPQATPPAAPRPAPSAGPGKGGP